MEVVVELGVLGVLVEARESGPLTAAGLAVATREDGERKRFTMARSLFALVADFLPAKTEVGEAEEIERALREFDVDTELE